jgi:hypothetical protein
MNPQITEYIQNAPEPHQQIMQAIRTLIHQQVPGVVEEYKWSRPVFRAAKDFAYLQANKQYVTLGFTGDLSKLDDPQGLLEGTGKTMRHIKIRNMQELAAAPLAKWLHAISQ